MARTHHRITTRQHRFEEAPSRSQRGIGEPEAALLEWEEDLVRGILSGSARHFDRFYEEYFSRVYGFALQRLGDPGEAEQATREVFEVALRALERWHRGSSLLVAMLGITLNVVRQRRRLSAASGLRARSGSGSNPPPRTRMPPGRPPTS